jgi:hypothetical protein
VVTGVGIGDDEASLATAFESGTTAGGGGMRMGEWGIGD